MPAVYFAQIDSDGIVFAVSQLTDFVDQPDMIQIESYDISLLGKRYNPETGQFEDVQPQE